ncbi:hypothetical protein ACVIRO_002255 [Rhizobium ruizarguesonis]
MKPNFRFTHYDLKEQRAGTIIEVSLNAVNNVRLMTAPNFQRFTEVLDFKYISAAWRANRRSRSPFRKAVTGMSSSIWKVITGLQNRPSR